MFANTSTKIMLAAGAMVVVLGVGPAARAGFPEKDITLGHLDKSRYLGQPPQELLVVAPRPHGDRR